MYRLNEQQIDFILNDIRARGVKMEGLQLNLLDHVCCIIEQNLEPGGDFEAFYYATIQSFYQKELREIEEETIQLLTYKNYYAMKKIMIISGVASAVLLTLGIGLKFAHCMGASALLVLGISSFSLLFLPLVFLLKVKENQNVTDRVVIGLGTLSAILLSMGILFKIMHWPGANAMGIVMLIIMGLLFLPIYFFSGIRRAETKVNTIVSSVLIVGACGLFLALVRSPAGTRQQNIADTGSYVRNEQILKTEQRQIEAELKNAATNTPVISLSKQINTMCEELKTFIVEGETGSKTISTDFESANIFISDRLAENYFSDGTAANQKLEQLRQMIKQYNTSTAGMSNPNLHTIAIKATVLDQPNHKIADALNDFIQIQMALFQNERELVR